MTWAERYGNLRTWEQRGSVFRAPFSVPCEVCCRPTEFVDIDYETAFCSDECLASFESRIQQQSMYCCDTCGDGKKQSCPHAKGVHYSPWSDGIPEPDYCPQKNDELAF